MKRNFWCLVGFELKKILKRKIVWIAFGLVSLVMLFMGVYTLIFTHEVDNFRVTAHEERIAEKEAVKKISGRPVDDVLLEELANALITGENSAVYQHLYDNMVRTVYGKISGEKLLQVLKNQTGFYDARRQVIEQNMEAMYLTEEEVAYWNEVLKEEETPWTFEYCNGIAMAWVAAYTAIVLIALMLAVCLANIFSEEHQKKTDQLVLCSKNGKQILYGAKIAAGFLFTTGSTVIILLITALPQVLLLGTDGWNSPIQLYMPLSLLDMTFGEMLGYTYMTGLLAALLYASVTMCCSEMFRNSNVAVMALITVLVLVPMMVVIPYEYRVLSQMLELNPISVLSVWSVNEYRLIPFFGRYFTMKETAPVLYVLLAAGCVALGGRLYKRYQVSGR